MNAFVWPISFTSVHQLVFRGLSRSQWLNKSSMVRFEPGVQDQNANVRTTYLWAHCDFSVNTLKWKKKKNHFQFLFFANFSLHKLKMRKIGNFIYLDYRFFWHSTLNSWSLFLCTVNAVRSGRNLFTHQTWNFKIRTKFFQSEAFPLHSGWVDLCDHPKRGRLRCAIF